METNSKYLILAYGAMEIITMGSKVGMVYGTMGTIMMGSKWTFVM